MTHKKFIDEIRGAKQTSLSGAKSELDKFRHAAQQSSYVTTKSDSVKLLEAIRKAEEAKQENSDYTGFREINQEDVPETVSKPQADFYCASNSVNGLSQNVEWVRSCVEQVEAAGEHRFSICFVVPTTVLPAGTSHELFNMLKSIQQDINSNFEPLNHHWRCRSVHDYSATNSYVIQSFGEQSVYRTNDRSLVLVFERIGLQDL